MCIFLAEVSRKLWVKSSTLQPVGGLTVPCRRGVELVAGFPSCAPFHLLPIPYATVRALKELLPAGSDYPVLHL